MGARRLSAAGLAAGLVLLAGSVAAGSPASAAVTDPVVFTADGSFVVPAGVTSVTIEAFGAQGGSAADWAESSNCDGPLEFSGGLGGSTAATVDVTPGETLVVRVGGRGGDGSCDAAGAGGSNGGGTSLLPVRLGPGAQSTGGGGGASDVRRGGSGLGDRVVVAAGGGGAAVKTVGGSGGGTDGANGGNGQFGSAIGGGGGTQTAGGAAGLGEFNDPNWAGQSGAVGSGGDGGTNNCPWPSGGGGGGGGWFGGGGGGGGCAAPSGGGGGSGYAIPAARDVALTAGVRAGAGQVTITAILAPVSAQTITFNPLPAKVLGVAPFAVAATASSGLPVTFTTTTPAVCTVTGAQVTVLAVGTCTIQAGQAGNASFTAAPPVTQSFPVTAAAVSPAQIANTGGEDTGRIAAAGLALLVFGAALVLVPGRRQT